MNRVSKKETIMRELERVCGEDINSLINDDRYINLSTRCVELFNKLKLTLNESQLNLLMDYEEAVAKKQVYIENGVCQNVCQD